MLISHYSNISELHEVTRAARNAVSAAYICRLKRLSKFHPGTVHFKRGHPRLEQLVPLECRDCDPDPEELYENALELIRNTENL
jgi:hypothetical protein